MQPGAVTVHQHLGENLREDEASLLGARGAVAIQEPDDERVEARLERELAVLKHQHATRPGSAESQRRDAVRTRQRGGRFRDAPTHGAQGGSPLGEYLASCSISAVATEPMAGGRPPQRNGISMSSSHV